MLDIRGYEGEKAIVLDSCSHAYITLIGRIPLLFLLAPRVSQTPIATLKAVCHLVRTLHTLLIVMIN